MWLRVLGFTLQLPEGGLPCGEEIEISVSLTAPDVVGRYVSHWRLLAPSGRKFGHRVWVMIQVICQANTSVKEHNYVNVEVNHDQHLDEAIVEKGMFAAPSMVNAEEDSSIHTADMQESGDGVALSDRGNQPVSDMEMDIELDGFSVVEKPVEIPQPERVSSSTEKEMIETDVEMEMKELESLGFDNREQNFDWLKKTDGSVQVALENLIACAGWEETMRNLRAMVSFTRLPLCH